MKNLTLLGDFYPIAKEIGIFLARKICEAIDWVIPFDSSEENKNRSDESKKNEHNG